MRGGRSGARRVAAIDSGARLVESSRTTRDEPQPRTWALRAGVAVAAVAGALAATGLSVAAASFADEAGDANAAPDITSIRVSVSADALARVDVSIGNYMTLPGDSWINVWFDDDSNDGTGYGGDETLVRYLSSGQLEFYEWDGLAMLRKELPARITGTFSDGVLTATVPTSDLGGDSAFGVLAISSLRQQVVLSQFTSSDFAPDRGSSAYTGPALATFSDPGNDEDVAPDIGGVRVVDTKDGWIRFAVDTPNYAALTADSALWIGVDTDNRAATNDDDQAPELRIGHRLGQTTIERWRPRSGGWVEEAAADLVRGGGARGVVTIDLRRSAVGGAKRFGFSVTTADFDPNTGVVHALDLAPSNGGFYRYVFTNDSAFALVAGQVSATPRAPRAGSRFAVTLPVRRSDTGRPAATGTVTCRASVGRAALSGVGTLTRAGARCSFAVPGSAGGKSLRGAITVRSAGKIVSRPFSYVVR